MDRRNFLRTASSFALLVTGATTGVSRVFTESPISSLSGNLSDKNTPNADDTMEYRKLGELDVSAIGLGCLPMVGYYGGKYDKKDMIALIRRAYDKGVTFFDTAEVYTLHQRRVGRRSTRSVSRQSENRNEVRLRCRGETTDCYQ